MIVKNSLLGLDKCIYQNDEWFKFSLDSVLLSKFVTVGLRCKNVMDLACGNAPIPIFLTYRTNAKIYGVEYQKCVYDLGVKSIDENKLGDRIELVNDDVRNLKKSLIVNFLMLLCVILLILNIIVIKWLMIMQLRLWLVMKLI